MGCWRYIQDIFEQIEEFRAFELLRTGLDRTHYLSVKEAKIIAMTCTHAALKRKDLVKILLISRKFFNLINAQCSKIRKKVQFQKYKNTFFTISKMAKNQFLHQKKV